MTSQQFITHYLADLQQVIARLDSSALVRAIDWLREARDTDHHIYICGNGGSASIASEMVVDMVKGASLRQPKRFRMMSLTDSIATITAYANDEDYADVFVEPLKNFARPADVVIAISGSGNSVNVLKAIDYANEIGCRTIGLTTNRSGKLKDAVQLLLGVSSEHMGRLEDSFYIMTHVLAYACIEQVESLATASSSDKLRQ